MPPRQRHGANARPRGRQKQSRMLGAGPLGGRGGSRRWSLLPLLLLCCPLATMPGRRGEAAGPRSGADAGALVPTCAPTTTTGWGRLRSSPPIASQLRPAPYRRRSRGPGSVRRLQPRPPAAPTAAICPKPPSGSAASPPGSRPERELRSPPEAASVKAPYLRPFLRSAGTGQARSSAKLPRRHCPATRLRSGPPQLLLPGARRELAAAAVLAGPSGWARGLAAGVQRPPGIAVPAGRLSSCAGTRLPPARETARRASLPANLCEGGPVPRRRRDFCWDGSEGGPPAGLELPASPAALALRCGDLEGRAGRSASPS